MCNFILCQSVKKFPYPLHLSLDSVRVFLIVILLNWPSSYLFSLFFQLNGHFCVCSKLCRAHRTDELPTDLLRVSTLTRLALHTSTPSHSFRYSLPPDRSVSVHTGLTIYLFWKRIFRLSCVTTKTFIEHNSRLLNILLHLLQIFIRGTKRPIQKAVTGIKHSSSVTGSKRVSNILQNDTLVTMKNYVCKLVIWTFS